MGVSEWKDPVYEKDRPEPYRMFTSRAEYRLLLREDNAVFRLYKYAKKFALLEDRFIDEVEERWQNISDGIGWLKRNYATPTKSSV